MDYVISRKWPAARLVGPDVSQEHALDFIRRTDKALVGHGFCNNHAFEADLKKWLDLDDPFATEMRDFTAAYALREAYEREAGFVRLEHLASHWVSSAFIGGPHGPVSPTGRVVLAGNFGKWPSSDEVEKDLSKLAPAFPWLTFDLALWGHEEETTEGEPSCFWHVEGGEWSRAPAHVLKVSDPDHVTTFILGLNNPMRENTWTVPAIDFMWGAEHRAALARAKAFLAEEKARA